MEILTTIFLVFLFLAIYFMSFFIILLFFNHKKVFYFPKPNKKYSISFLIPAYNEENSIEKTIEAIFASTYPIKEVIVINDSSKDNTKKIVRRIMKKYKKLKLINNKKNMGKANSLNKAIKEARGELIAVTDADSYPIKEAVERMVGFFNDSKTGAVTSSVFVRNKNSFFEKVQEIEYIMLAWTRKMLDFIHSVYVTNGPLSIYRKKIVREVGGFDPKSITEDIEITWNILSRGYKTHMSFSARVYTTAPSKLKKWWKQRVRWGVGGIETIFKYKKNFFRKGMFGFFIMPFVAFTIFMSVAAFILGIYLIYKDVAVALLTAGYSLSLQTTVFRLQNVNTHPTIMLIMVGILFIFSFLYSTYVFKVTKQTHIIKLSKIFNRLFYMLVYLTLYPLVWFDSIYRVIFEKKHKW